MGIRASHGDDDLSSSVSRFHVAHGLGDLAERVRPIDDGRDLPGLDELLEHDQLLAGLLRHERAQLLTNGDSICARSWRSMPPNHRPPPSPPTMTWVPRGA